MDVMKSETVNLNSKHTKTLQRTYCKFKPKHTHHLRIQVHLVCLGAASIVSSTKALFPVKLRCYLFLFQKNSTCMNP